MIDLPGGQLGAAAIIGAGALLTLALAELVRRLGGSAELSRKTAHVGSGLLATSFPYVFESAWLVTAIAASFVVIVVVTRRTGRLKGVHGVDRESLGAYAFPVVIALLFWLTPGRPELYVIPLLVLAVSDAAAALVGKTYGTVHYKALGERRSLEGSSAFFVVTFVVVHVPLLLYDITGRLDSVLIALSVAILVTAFEAISVRGLDNLFVPIGTWYALHNYLLDPAAENWERLGFFVVFGVVSEVLRLTRFLTRTGAVGFFLCAYAAWSLGGWAWLVPLVASYGFVLAMSGVLRRRRPETPPMGLSRLFQVAITAVVVLFAYDQTQDGSLYVPYLAAVCGGAALVALTLARALGGRLVGWVTAGAATPVLAATAMGHWALLPAGVTAVAVVVCGGIAALLASALAPSAASFQCEACTLATHEPRHCEQPAKLTSGHRQWTESRAAWASIALGTLVAFLLT